MFKIRSLLFFTIAATLLSTAAGQSWEVMVYEGSNSCTGGGTTISGSDFNCHTVGLGSNAASFKVLQDQGTPGAEFVCRYSSRMPLLAFHDHCHRQLICSPISSAYSSYYVAGLTYLLLNDLVRAKRAPGHSLVLTPASPAPLVCRRIH